MTHKKYSYFTRSGKKEIRHSNSISIFPLSLFLDRRAVPVAGRMFNITTEIYELAEQDLLRTFFISPAGNVCFHG